MSSTLRATLVANAGLLLEYAGTTLLLDGIYENELHGFSNLAPDVWQKMLSGAQPFTSISSLLFTHQHPDHFSPSMTLAYLQKRKVSSVFIPEGTPRPNGLLNFLNEFRIRHVYLSERAKSYTKFHLKLRCGQSVHCIWTNGFPMFLIFVFS